MKTASYFLLMVSLLNSLAIAQTTYKKSFFDAAEYEQDSKITKGTNGNYVFYGWTHQGTQTDSKGVIMKLDGNGQPIYTKKLTHPDYLRIVSADVNSIGEMIIAGRILSSVDQNFILKTDASGNEIWNVSFEPFIEKAIWMTNGNILASLGDRIAVFNSAGDTIFTFSNGGYIRDIAETADGNIIIFQNQAIDYFLELIKINNNGAVLWNKWYKYSSDNFTWENGIKILPIENNEFLTMSQISFIGDVNYITKHDSDGTVIWNTALIDPYPSFQGKDLMVDSFGQITTLFQRAGSSANDDCIIKLDSNGNFISSKLLPLVARASSIEESWDGGYIIGGNYFEVNKTNTAGNVNCSNILGSPTSDTTSPSAPIYLDTVTPASPMPFVLGLASISISNHLLDVETDLDIDIPPICFAGVNEEGNGNMIVWDKGSTTEIKEYKIYRESGMNYLHLGTVPYDSLSEYHDTINISPQVSSTRYKISAVDQCNHETALSPFHQTVHLTSSLGTSGEVNLIWAPYQGTSFGYYRISRDTIGNGIFVPIDSVNSSGTTYIDFNASTGVSSYIIEVLLSVNCSSTKSLYVYSVSRSNKTIINKSGSTLTGDLNGNGVIDTGEVAGDADGNGVINGGEICGDINGDGQISGSETAGDINGNGIINGNEIAGDINGDGIIQSWEKIGDINGDGLLNNNEVWGDANGNGIIDNGEIASIKENRNLFLLNLFPNPTSGIINIETNTLLILELYSIIGEIVLISEISNSSSININNLHSGMYFMKLSNPFITEWVKIVKK